MLPFLLDLGFSVAEIGLGVMGLALAVVGLPPSANRAATRRRAATEPSTVDTAESETR